MPIVDPEIIKSGEKELFASILASFDEFQIEKLFQETHNLLLKEKMQFKGGKTIAYKNQIAYKFFFNSVAEFSVLGGGPNCMDNLSIELNSELCLLRTRPQAASANG